MEELDSRSLANLNALPSAGTGVDVNVDYKPS